MEFNQISEKFIQEMKSKCKDPEIEFYEDDKTIKYIGDFNYEKFISWIWYLFSRKW